MNTLKYTLILSVALAGLALLGGCRSHPSGEEAVPPAAKSVAVSPTAGAHRPAPVQAPRILSATGLAQTFAADPKAASRLAHQRITIRGEVDNLEAGGQGVPVLTLRGGAGLTDPRLVLEAEGWTEVSTLKAGSTVTALCGGASVSAGHVTAEPCTLL